MEDSSNSQNLTCNNHNGTNKNNLIQSRTSDLNGKIIDGKGLPEILVISSYPPRECGIATYSQDLIRALNHKFGASFSIKVCALENGENRYTYGKEVKYILNTSKAEEFYRLADDLNSDSNLKIVFIQHEFGLFSANEEAFMKFLQQLKKSVVIAFHSVLPNPDYRLKEKVIRIAEVCKSIIVMTHKSAQVLMVDYGIAENQITVIPHGTHLVPHLDKSLLKEKYGLKHRTILSTFGLLSSGKGIETTLIALPSIIRIFPEVMFLIIGKTHPGVVKSEGEVYREKLISMVNQLDLKDHVTFINNYLELPELLEYLQLTDIYLFTSLDPNQAVSGTFAYAMSCACPIISTPIPHAKEVLTGDSGIIFDFGNSTQLAEAVIRLLEDQFLRENFAKNGLQKIISTVWENSAIAHVLLLERIASGEIKIIYSLPAINLNHLKKMTTDFGMIQFSKINQPDIESGYTLDDNARALYTFCQHYKLTGDPEDLVYIQLFLSFIKICQQEKGNFLNYLDKDKLFTEQNFTENLDDSNGRALMALSYLVTIKDILPNHLVIEAETLIRKALPLVENILSPRAMGFCIKALYHLNSTGHLKDHVVLTILTNRLVQMYHHEAEPDWHWFESYLTYSNSILPEAMVYAWLLTEKNIYREIAVISLDFLLSKTINRECMAVISNKKWHLKGSDVESFGEQSIDVAGTVQTLSVFYDVLGDEEYFRKMEIAFDWFLGKNRLHQIVYNPCTGGCFDGVEEFNINLNEGAESSLSYLMARLTVEKYRNQILSRGLLPEKKSEAQSHIKENEFKG